MLDAVKKWSIDFHFDRLAQTPGAGCVCHYRCRGCSGFGSFFVDRDECLMENF